MAGNEDYSDATVSLTAEVTKPSYGQCLRWLKERPDDSPVTFDYWARGNFTRRLIYNIDVLGVASTLLIDLGKPSAAKAEWPMVEIKYKKTGN